MTQLPANNIAEIMFIMDKDQRPENKYLEQSSPAIKINKIKSSSSGEKGHRQGQPPEPKEEKDRLKSKCRKIMVGLIISISAVMFGYSIKQITSVSIDRLVVIYNIGFNKFLAQSILIGVLPFAAIIGALIMRLMIKGFRRVTGIYIFTFVNIGAIVLVNINTFYTLLIGRFIEGICIGYYSAIAPVYLREIAPKELRRMLGLFFSFGKIVGVLVAIILELILNKAIGLSWDYRIILSLTAGLSVLQAILIFFFGSDTPTEMLERGDKEGAKTFIEKFYHEEHVDDVMKEYTQEYEASQMVDVEEDESASKKKKPKRNKADSAEKKEYQLGLDVSRNKVNEGKNDMDSFYQSSFDVRASQVQREEEAAAADISDSQSVLTETPKLTFEEKRKKAFILGVHMAGIKNFVGANALITQGGIFISLFNPGLGSWTSLIVNVIQFIAVVVGMVYVQTIMGKKNLFLISVPTLAVLNFALVIAMIYQNVPALLFLMCIFLTVFGMGYISPMWAYPVEVIPAIQQLPVNIFHWISISICMLIPPLVASFMPKNNPYPVFIFFGIYTFIGFIHIRSTLRESDGLTYKEIITSFK